MSISIHNQGTSGTFRDIPKSRYQTRSVTRKNAIPHTQTSRDLTFPPPHLTQARGDTNLDSSLDSLEGSEGLSPSPQNLKEFLLSFSEVKEVFGAVTVKLLRKLQKADFKGKKALLDKAYLQHCIELHIFPKWLNIKVGNLHNRSQQKIISDFKMETLKNEFFQKKIKARECFKIRNTLERDLASTLGAITTNQWLTRLQEQNKQALNKVEIRQFRKMTKLLLDNHKIDRDSFLKMEANGSTEIGGDLQVIFNLSSHVLSAEEETGLKNGLKFIPTPKKIDEVELYANLEALVGTIYYTQKNPPELSELASSLSREAKNSIERFYHNRPLHNLPKKVGLALQALAKRKDLVIAKPDKGNGIVLLNRSDYVQKMENILNDPTKFKKVPTSDPYKATIGLETQVRLVLRNFMNHKIIDKYKYEKIYPKGSRPCLLYGLPKVHKVGAPLRPILSAIGSAVHGLAQLLVPILAPLTTNQHTVSNSFLFTEELRHSTVSNAFLASFDICSLFTNIPLNETIDIIKKANKKGKLSIKMNDKLLGDALRVTTENCAFSFNDENYIQVDGVAMGSPLGPTLANIFMCHFEQEFLEAYEGPPPLLYRRYVDDILLAFENEAQVTPFWEYLNQCHRNIKFTVEREENRGINFLDISVKRVPETNEILTQTFRKKTYTGLLMKHNSFTHSKYKTGLIQCLLFRALKICSKIGPFLDEIAYLKSIFIKNRFPLDLFEKSVREFKAKHSESIAKLLPQT